MEQEDLSQIEKQLTLYRKKIILLEEIIKKSTEQKAKMAKLLGKLISRDNDKY